MKKTTVLLVFTAFLLCVQPSTAQNIFFTMVVGDTSVLSLTGAYGSIQWQKSPDSLNWTNISGATSNPQTIITDTSFTGKRYYRAKVTDSFCTPYTPVYSSVIRHKILTTLSQVQIGNWFRGGIVFYVSGNSGLISATQDHSMCEWGCYGSLIGSSAQSNTNGATNTAAIVAFHDGLNNYYGNPTQCSSNNDGTVAAKLCDTLTLNRYTDWFLPAKDQLHLLYQQQNIVGGFAGPYYWSSTESDAQLAWYELFGSGGKVYTAKSDLQYIRCIRSY